MSAEAIAKVQRLWEKLSFHRVKRVIAREPEDILYIEVTEDTGHSRTLNGIKRTQDIPQELRSRAKVVWRHYYGFTEDNVFFHNNDYCELDTDIDLTLEFSGWGNHHSGEFKQPAIGQLIAGEVIDTEKGKRLHQWFTVDKPLKLLIDLVRAGGTNLSDDYLGRHLVTHGWPDKYWAIARLLFHDNVQAFVDQALPHEKLPQHPAHGIVTGYTSSGKPLTVGHRGMWLSQGHLKWLHVMSYRFEPKWWEIFKNLTGATKHELALGDWCAACQAEREESRLHAGDDFPRLTWADDYGYY